MLLVCLLDIIFISLLLTRRTLDLEIIGMIFCCIMSLLFGLFDRREHVNNGGY